MKNIIMHTKYAYTVAEILICLVVIGILAVFLLSSINTKKFDEKAYIANAYKIVDIFNQTSIKVKETEREKCPTGNFMEMTVDNKPIFTILNSENKEASAQDIMDMYSDYLKFDKKNISFCTNSGKFCENQSVDDTQIAGAKIAGSDVYIGIEKTGIINCPDFRHPNSDGSQVVAGKGNCWGKLYIDTNGKAGPNEADKDIYVFGLSDSGVTLQGDVLSTP